MNEHSPSGSGPLLCEGDYARAVEQLFQRLRGKPMLLSPEDFQRVLRWYRDEIPLPLVLTTMKLVFQRALEQKPRRRPSSLAYCEGAIEEAWDAAREAALGGRSWQPTPDPDLAGELERVALAVLESSAPEAARLRTAERLRALVQGDSSFTENADAVIVVDRELLEDCRQTLTPGQVEELVQDTHRQLAPFRTRLSPSDLEKTARLIETRTLRRMFRLPDISLLPIIACGIFPAPGDKNQRP